MKARVRAFFVGAIVTGAIAILSGGTYAAFFSTTQSDGNGFAAGTVYLQDNDSGSRMFNASGMRPSDPPKQSCITVTYNGTLDAGVRLYAASVSSTGVEWYLNLRVETGTSTTGFDDCSGFSAIQTLYDGTLAGYPRTYGGAIVDPDGAWTTGERHTYRFTVSVQNQAAAQGMTGSASFTWQARNL